MARNVFYQLENKGSYTDTLFQCWAKKIKMADEENTTKIVGGSYQIYVIVQG